MPDAAASPPGLEEVERIAALDDPVLRNIQITQCYHELSAGLARWIHPGANWCTFATWASKQAGQTIRKEDLKRTLESLVRREAAGLEASQETAAMQQAGAQASAAEIQENVWEVVNPGAAFERASQAVSRGNRKVFAEIGYQFARFLSACTPDEGPDPDKIAGFCEGLHPGEPPDGQGYLSQSFRRYYAALFEADPKQRAELILLANLEIGFHEQARLQPEIREALEAALVDPGQLATRLITAIFPYRGLPALIRRFWLHLLGRPAPYDAAIHRLLAQAQRQVRLVITEYLMVITLPPDVRVRLGDDLRATFPDSLRQLSNPDLRALLAQIDPTPDSPAGSGALDWGDLHDRMHFIADLFRCHQEAPELFSPPFSLAQIDEIRAGRLPSGRL